MFCLYESLCTMCMPGACRGLKRESDHQACSSKQTWAIIMLVLQHWTQFLWKRSQRLYHWVISLNSEEILFFLIEFRFLYNIFWLKFLFLQLFLKNFYSKKRIHQKWAFYHWKANYCFKRKEWGFILYISTHLILENLERVW